MVLFMDLKPKKCMTSLDVAAWINEVRSTLVGARVSNVQRVPNTKILLLKLYGVKGEYKRLVIEPSVRIHMTLYNYPVEETPDPIISGFRKAVRGSRIESIEQVGFDRIIKIVFSSNNTLYVELIPRGEAVLVDENENILQATEFKELKDRVLKRGEIYKLPPYYANKPSIGACKNIEIKDSLNAIEVARALGLPPEAIEEALYRSTSCKADFCEALINLINESLEPGGWIIEYKGKLASVAPFRPTRLERIEDCKLRFVESFNKALDEYFTRIYEASLIKAESANLTVEVSRIKKSIEKQKKIIQEYMNEYKKLNEIANKILLNKNYLEEIIRNVILIIKSKGWSFVKKEVPEVKDVEPSKGLIYVELPDNTIIPIPLVLSVKEYMNQLFNKSKKLKKKAESAEEHVRVLEEKLKKLRESIEKSLEETKVVVRKREWYERFNWSFTRNKLLVLAGRDSSQNEVLVKRYLTSKDLFLHADIHGASATILKDSDKACSGDIEDAAVVAACYSKAWSKKLASIDVFWVKAEQVSKTPPSGEYLPKGSFMIYGKKNYVRNVKLELAVGYDEENHKIVLGSLEAISRNYSLIAILTPGDLSREEVSKRILKIVGLSRREFLNDLAPRIPGSASISIVKN